MKITRGKRGSRKLRGARGMRKTRKAPRPRLALRARKRYGGLSDTPKKRDAELLDIIKSMDPMFARYKNSKNNEEMASDLDSVIKKLVLFQKQVSKDVHALQRSQQGQTGGAADPEKDLCILCLAGANEDGMGELYGHAPTYGCSARAHKQCWNEIYNTFFRSGKSMCLNCNRVLSFSNTSDGIPGVPEDIRTDIEEIVGHRRDPVDPVHDAIINRVANNHYLQNMMARHPIIEHMIVSHVIVFFLVGVCYVTLNIYSLYSYNAGSRDEYNILGVTVLQRERRQFGVDVYSAIVRVAARIFNRNAPSPPRGERFYELLNTVLDIVMERIVADNTEATDEYRGLLGYHAGGRRKLAQSARSGRFRRKQNRRSSRRRSGCTRKTRK